MPDARHHVSSAVVTTRPEASQSVIDRLGLLEGVEVHAAAAGKIVVVIEGPTAGYLGDRLIQISAMEDVLAAHMVFEQAMDEEDMFDDGGTHAA
jgi:nitrate reductase NapD